MTPNHAIAQHQIAQVFAQEGRDLLIETPGVGAYDPATATVATATPTTQVVRGKLYTKRVRQQDGDTWVTVERQKCVLEARGIVTAPTLKDILIDGESRYAITESHPQGDPALTYELFLSKA